MKFDVARRLVGLDILDEPGRADLPRAKVTSECFSPTFGKSLALGFVSTPAIDTGSAVRLGDGRIARVAALPFYDPKRRRPRDNPI
jgi:glycine cleavage system aminomethyltransferase T